MNLIRTTPLLAAALVLAGCAGPLGGGSGSAPLFGTSAGVQLNIPSPIPVAGTSAMTVAPAVSAGPSFAIAAPVCAEPQDNAPVFAVRRAAKIRTSEK